MKPLHYALACVCVLMSTPVWAQVRLVEPCHAPEEARELECVRIPEPIPGPPGQPGAPGPRGPAGPAGPPGILPTWPLVVPGVDALVAGLTVYATVPKLSGWHDKILYTPDTKTAYLIDQGDGVRPRCYQVAPHFHAEHTFSGVTVDAARAFTWHDATGFWAGVPWDVTLPCVPF